MSTSRPRCWPWRPSGPRATTTWYSIGRMPLACPSLTKRSTRRCRSRCSNMLLTCQRRWPRYIARCGPAAGWSSGTWTGPRCLGARGTPTGCGGCLLPGEGHLDRAGRRLQTLAPSYAGGRVRGCRGGRPCALLSIDFDPGDVWGSARRPTASGNTPSSWAAWMPRMSRRHGRPSSRSWPPTGSSTAHVSSAASGGAEARVTCGRFDDGASTTGTTHCA